MADISNYLKKILDAIYGEEVRGAIHDGMMAMNVESNAAMEYAATAKDSAMASAAKAKDSADLSSTKAAEAVNSANAAKVSETGAREAETNAISKAEDAANRAAAAKVSETNSANSEAIALQKASEAEASKNAAAISEVNALAAEQRTKDIKDDVESLGAQATADKNAAEAARDVAKVSQDAASLSATNAALSASQAEDAKNAAEEAQSASEIAQSASEAAQAATETARDNAESSEEAAKTSEENAALSAETAKQYSGKSPKPQNGTWWIWNADDGVYEDTGISCELVGPTGNGIDSIVLTSGDHMPGSTDKYTVTMTDGSTKEIPVYNGKNGTGTGDVMGIAFDIEIPTDGWNDGSITISDNRFVASARYKYFVDVYDAYRDEVKESKIRPTDITVNGHLNFTSEYEPLTNVIANVLRVEVNGSGDTQ